MSYEPQRPAWHEELTVRGLRHRLTWWGARTEAPIVLLHGIMDCGATWQFLVDCLPTSWSVVAPDWRGFGHTEWAAGGYWFPDYLADLEALLDVLVPRSKVRLIAHSMGANIAQLYGGTRATRLAWLVNLEGLGLRRSAPEDAPTRYAQWLDELREPLRTARYRSVEQLASVLRSRNPRLPLDKAEFIARAWTREAGLDTEVELLFDPRHRLVNPVLYRREEAEACWSRIEAPVLLLTGEQSAHRSQYLSQGGDEALRSRIRRLSVVTLPGVGHMMHHEDPAAVARHILEFDGSCSSSAPLLSAAPEPI